MIDINSIDEAKKDKSGTLYVAIIRTTDGSMCSAPMPRAACEKVLDDFTYRLKTIELRTGKRYLVATEIQPYEEAKHSALIPKDVRKHF